MTQSFFTSGHSPVVVVTGGSSGIGLAASKRFFAAGCRIAICGRDHARLVAACNQIPQHVPIRHRPIEETLLSFTCDIGDETQVARFVREVEQRWETVDILVNNAAVAPLAPVMQTSVQDFRNVVAINLAGPWHLVQAVWPGMAQRQRGVIVNVSSLAAIDPFRGFSLYGASKAWLETWTKALATEGADVGIRVVGVRPGAVETPLLRSLFPDFPGDQCVTADEVADVLVGLAMTEEHPSGSIITVAQTEHG
ncbi:MAG: SDR family oxidoreductase [Pirellulaceae bacterium]|nr:SDR family oxidoreductase [Pirellulaceae bacterium]